MNIAATGTEFWEIESDDMAEVFEQIADEHAADWESTVDGLALEEGYFPPSPPVPWSSLRAAFVDFDQMRPVSVNRYDVRVTGSNAATVVPARRAS